MDKKSYYSISGAIFLIVGVLHLLRVINGWTVTMGNFAAPMWASWIAIILAGILAYHGLVKR